MDEYKEILKRDIEVMKIGNFIYLLRETTSIKQNKNLFFIN